MTRWSRIQRRTDMERPASYENGKVVDSMGRICQVSSTLYNAVLYAERQLRNDMSIPFSLHM